MTLVKALKGDSQAGPADSVISTLGFDQQNGKMSWAWFMAARK